MKFRIINCLIMSMTFAFANDISGIYLLPKDSKNRQSIVEVFNKNERFYGVGFSTTNGINNDLDLNNPDKKLQNRPIRGSVFLNLNCFETPCTGQIYSFEKGKTYPVKATLTNNTLEIKVDAFFGPTLIWEKLDKSQAAKYENQRLDVNSLELMK
ncbi:DUF2147 domain-containing protein [Helicobacter trogontum]|uniref:DUF2147 domain-containing protein n=1 Tax=Helicobacter trogontum TaxID=50960 RepID=A0A4U8T9H0_9HELI|nr:DUF2147 domain-containing protein [Helicobacter trogontum]MCI5787277.1 DUF2147 domain-containing protein [Helicobacter trogontum]MDY5185784.1 DUF2147 domain-containing protein [Helicobacter trogontum]TLD96460.1 DUF2147 domain-containing protein [Helicobacter trogontum]